MTPDELIETLAKALSEIAALKPNTTVGVVAGEALSAYAEYAKADVERRTWLSVERRTDPSHPWRRAGGEHTSVETALESARYRAPYGNKSMEARVVRVSEVVTVIADKEPTDYRRPAQRPVSCWKCGHSLYCNNTACAIADKVPEPCKPGCGRVYHTDDCPRSRISSPVIADKVQSK